MESQKNNQDKHHDHVDEKQLDQNHNNGSHENGETVVEAAVTDTHNETAMCLAELSIWKDQCKRISAEFENFKRRTERDQIRWAEIAKESLLSELLSFVDTFDMALQQKGGTDCSGIEMTYQSLMKLLQKHDVVVMKSMKHFDPEFHEAVMQVQADTYQSGDIVEILAKGFMMKDRVLRPAKVSVAV